jgi:acetyl-CoA carboxylase carboxyl transferase subunit beta
MAEISSALMDHRGAGLPYLVYLRHPTTGGVYASWGSLGHLTVAEPESLVGFLGPKVYEAVNGRPFPSGVQTAENLAAKGVIDAVVAPEELRELLDRTLAVLSDPASPPSLRPRTGAPRDRPAWDVIETSRAAARPGVRELLRYAGARTIRLRGTDEGERDDTVLVALTRLDGRPCVVVGQDRARQRADRPMGPAALREARRAMRLADELRLPLVTVIDTPGAELSPHGEEGAIAGEIARCIATLATMAVPTVSVLLGQGCGGGALALLPARTVIAAENAWLSPLPPEGASAIRYGDTAHAAEMAAQQRVRAVDLLADGVVGTVVAEPADDTPQRLVEAVAAEVVAALATSSAPLDT